jgi:hypothetical protein
MSPVSQPCAIADASSGHRFLHRQGRASDVVKFAAVAVAVATESTIDATWTELEDWLCVQAEMEAAMESRLACQEPGHCAQCQSVKSVDLFIYL